LREGFSCENTFIDYLPTKTAIGHASVYTGSVPSIHGIAGNDFYIQETGKVMYCTDDSTVSSVGSSSKAGKMSPRNLWTSTITDELKLATNFRSKVIGISLKDRGAILPAGHAANAAYWFDDETGNWISSTFYMQALPSWVNEFNSKKLLEKYLQNDWHTLYPADTYVQSIDDDNRYEEITKGAKSSALPLKTSLLLKNNGIKLIRSTPYGNTFTLDMAKAAIENESLGSDNITDFLAVSLSSTDYIGHQYAPNSVEIEDTYLRLDKDLEAFIAYLDKTIGKSEYLLMLTADHGGAHNPHFLNDRRIPAGAFVEGEMVKQLNSLLKSRFGFDRILLGLTNYQVNLNNTLIKANNLDLSVIKEVCMAFLKQQEGVAYVVDMDKIQESPVPEPIKSRIINGYNAERSGVVQVVLKPGWLSGSKIIKGSNHGVWNAYDAHIPLIFMGAGVKKGKSYSPVHITDIAPTLAFLLNIQTPNGAIGKPVTEVFSGR
jgi:hypothetical protein